MEQFFAFVFYTIVGLYLLRLVVIYVFPWLLARWMKRMVRRMEQQQQQSQDSFSTSSHPKSKLNDVGEYVDFEEIKDNKDKPH